MVWNYQQPRRRQTLSKLLLAIFGIFVIGGGVSFASLISQQAKLTGNVIQTATANLQIGPDGVAYGDSLSGFSFSNLVPGGQAMPLDGYAIFLKNGGGTPLALHLAVTTTPLNPNNVDLSKVHVILTPIGGGSVQNFTLQSLIASASTGGQTILAPAQLMPSTATSFKLQISMEADAITGSSASISNVEFSFTGSA